MSMKSFADMKPRIIVVGVGGGGGNAVNNMMAAGLTGVKFIAANTDAQALSVSSAEHRLQLGAKLTDGIGAGAKHEIGEAAAEEALEDIRGALAGAHMVFIAAGMGGGTGTGAAPVIARIAKEFGILTVAVVTKPFLFEGKKRMKVAEAGIAELKRHVDTLIVIPNQNLFNVANDRTAFAEAFVLADQVLYSGVACIVDLVVKDGLINLDLADVRTVLSGMGTAMMGTGEATGEQRAIVAAKDAIYNPLLDDVTLKGAKSMLLSISGGSDLTLFEVHDAVDCVRQELDADANIIFGATLDDGLSGRIRVSIVASGMAREDLPSSRSAGRRPHSESDFRHRLSEAMGGLPPAEGDSHGEHPPQPGMRGRQPVPSVEDFPPVAQREYWAKSDAARRAGTQQPPESRKLGLLERLTGRRAPPTQSERRFDRQGGDTRTDTTNEDTDAPVFFARAPRK